MLRRLPAASAVNVRSLPPPPPIDPPPPTNPPSARITRRFDSDSLGDARGGSGGVRPGGLVRTEPGRWVGSGAGSAVSRGRRFSRGRGRGRRPRGFVVGAEEGFEVGRQVVGGGDGRFGGDIEVSFERLNVGVRRWVGPHGGVVHLPPTPHLAGEVLVAGRHAQDVLQVTEERRCRLGVLCIHEVVGYGHTQGNSGQRRPDRAARGGRRAGRSGPGTEVAKGQERRRGPRWSSCRTTPGDLVCGTRSAAPPTVTTVSHLVRVASSRRDSAKLLQRTWGSTPASTMRS